MTTPLALKERRCNPYANLTPLEALELDDDNTLLGEVAYQASRCLAVSNIGEVGNEFFRRITELVNARAAGIMNHDEKKMTKSGLRFGRDGKLRMFGLVIVSANVPEGVIWPK